MIVHTNREVQIGEMRMDGKYNGRICCEVMNSFQSDRAKRNDTTPNNGLFIGIMLPQSCKESYVLIYVLIYNNVSDSEGDVRKGAKKTPEVDMVMSADGANSRVVKKIDKKKIEAGSYECIIFLRKYTGTGEEKMKYYTEQVKMYVDDGFRTSTPWSS